jgi:hypothetical protein
MEKKKKETTTPSKNKNKNKKTLPPTPNHHNSLSNSFSLTFLQHCKMKIWKKTLISSMPLFTESVKSKYTECFCMYHTGFGK